MSSDARAVVDGPTSPTLVEPFFGKGGRVHLISYRVKVGKKIGPSSVGKVSLVFPPGVSSSTIIASRETESPHQPLSLTSQKESLGRRQFWNVVFKLVGLIGGLGFTTMK